MKQSDPVLTVVCDFRIWVQAVFRLSDSRSAAGKDASDDMELCHQENTGSNISEKTMKLPLEDTEIDMSEGIANTMFAVSPSTDNEVKGSLSPTVSMDFILHFLFYFSN